VYQGELDRLAKIEFLQSLEVMALPTTYRESKGLPVLEAWANAVPVVLPAHGTFPELMEAAHGGLLHEPHNAAALAEKLAELLGDPLRSAELGAAGQRTVREKFTSTVMAERHRVLYGNLIATSRPSGVPSLAPGVAQ
jgi:glycosyltransferase involved in cell wall biosynthesis